MKNDVSNKLDQLSVTIQKQPTGKRKKIRKRLEMTLSKKKRR